MEANNLRPNERRARQAVVWLFAMCLLGVVLAVSTISQLQLLLAMQEGTEFSEAEIARNDRRQQVLGIFYIIAYILTGIFFIRWFRLRAAQ